MKFGFVAWRDLAHPKAGGSEVVVDGWARQLQARGHEVTLLCGGPVGSRPYPAFRTGGTYSQYAGAAVVGARRLRECDVVVDVSNGIPFFAPLWHRGPVLCVVHHLHRAQWGEYFPPPVAAIGRVLEERVVPRVYRRAHFIGVSASTCADLRGIGVPAERIHLVENGPAAELRSAVPQPEAEEPTFLALGRLAPNKRIDLLLDMWERVRPEVGGRLVIAGDGPELPRLRARTVPGVEFAGRVSEAEKARLLGRAWLLVHAAPREGWGLVILEAAANATPAIAFDVEGVRDTVVDGTTGVLARDPDGFVAAWVQLAGDAAARQRLGRAAADRVGRTDWQQGVAALEAAAAAVIADRR